MYLTAQHIGQGWFGNPWRRHALLAQEPMILDRRVYVLYSKLKVTDLEFCGIFFSRSTEVVNGLNFFVPLALLPPFVR